MMQHSYGTVLFRLGQCQVLAGEHAKGRESLEEAVVVLGGETRLFSAIGEGWLRRRFLMLSSALYRLRPSVAASQRG